jgi:hypothetical protein
MGHVPFLMKPNLTAIYGATAVASAAGNTTSNTTNTITIDTGSLASVLPLTGGEFSQIRTDWIRFTATGNHYRIKGVSGSVITIDGSIPSNLGAVAYVIYACVDARCAWTNASTVTYIQLEATNPTQESFGVKVDIKRNANALATIINLKKTESTKVFPLGYVGNYLDSETPASVQCVQLAKAIQYAMLFWPSVTPKYSNILWYNTYGLTTHRDVLDVANSSVSTSTYRKERAVILKLDKEEDQFNNLSLKSLAVELV